MRVLAHLHKQRTAEDRSRPKPAPPAVAVAQSRIQSRTERRHSEIHTLRTKGMNITAVAEQLRLNCTTVRKFVRSAPLEIYTGQPVKGHVDWIDPLRILCAAGRRVVTSQRFRMMNSRHLGMAAASERYDASWKIGARRNHHQPSDASCRVHRRYAGFCCPVAASSTMPNPCSSPICVGAAASWRQAGDWRSVSWSWSASDVGPNSKAG